ncbi:MAG: cysteine desulfurase family protein [Spirochaetota bacterium]
MNRYYFDWASTAPMLPVSRDAYLQTALQTFGNPSSTHYFGKQAAKQLAANRNEFASLINVKEEHIVFTGGGTEANALVCEHVLHKRHSRHIVISGIEHPSVYEYGTAFREAGHTTTVLSTPGGYVAPETLAEALRPDTALVLIMAVNNVLGTLQNLAALSSVVRAHEKTHNTSVHLHADAVQAFGKIDTQVYLPHVDSCTVSAHKIQGPKGVGLLISKKPLTVLSPGGGQEWGLRPGTQDLPAVNAFLAAARYYQEHRLEHFSTASYLRERLRAIIQQFPQMNMLTPAEESSPYITAVSLPGIPAEVFVRVMDDQGFALAVGSACSSKSRQKIERVLRSCEFNDQICTSTVRISFGPETTEEDIDRLGHTMIQQAKLLSQALGLQQ